MNIFENKLTGKIKSLLFLIIIFGIVFSVFKSIELSELSIKSINIKFNWYSIVIYTIGFLLSIAISIILNGFIFMKAQKQNSQILFFKIISLSILSTIIIVTYIYVIFPEFAFGVKITNLFSMGLINKGIIIFSIVLFVSISYYVIKEMKRKFGHKVLTNFLIGKYREPVKETKILLFLDLLDSTKIAEAIGDEKFAAFLQKIYYDIGKPIAHHEGDIYSYVGDEVIITWNKREGLRNNNCIECFSAIKRKIEKCAKCYQNEYGFIPKFRAGMHIGNTMVTEVGYFKIFIHYFGDSLNTTARIVNRCDDLKREFLISEQMYHLLPEKAQCHFEGDFSLKGKSAPIKLYSIAKS